MSSTTQEDLPGATAPVLSATLLSRVHELNLDYLELLIAEHALAACADQLQHLPARLRTSIVALPQSARRLLAAVPFTLYSLGFEDEGFWRTVCHSAADAAADTTIDQRYAPSGTRWPQGSFCEVALLHAWHVATSNRLAARVVYAMPDATALRLAATPLWQIKRVAADHAGLLVPRWPTNPAFWPDLVRFASANDVVRLATTKLLGNQLIAAQLEASSAATRRISSPRLRARNLQLELRPR